MEKLNDMQSNQVADDELDQIVGGRKLFGVFTTEFFEFFGDRDEKDDFPGAAAKDNFGVSTLEMRVNPNKKRDTDDTQKVLKL